MLRTAVLLPCLSGLSDYTCTQSHPLALFPKWHKYCSSTGDEKILSWVWSSRCLGIYNRTTATSQHHRNHWGCLEPQRVLWVIDHCPLPDKGTQISCLEFPVHRIGTLDWTHIVLGQSVTVILVLFIPQSLFSRMGYFCAVTPHNW